MLSLGAMLGRLEGAVLLVALALYIWRSLSQDTAAEAVPVIEGMAGWRIAGLDPRGLGAHGGRMAAGDRCHGHRAGTSASARR
jgi:hypothetical protein